jgi:ABC-type dipeptide/oligopeptide/nickel transport system permease component
MELKYYIMRRILVLIPTVMGLTLLVFLLFNLVPEYMITAGLVSPHFQGAQRLQAIKIAEVVYGLTYANGQPIPIYLRYFLYLKDLLIGNWGFMTSNMFTGNVLTGIELYFPNTLQLTIFATIVTFIVSIPLGTYIGARPNSGADQVGRIFSLTGYAMPAFFLADALVIAFGKYLPIVGSISPLAHPPPWALSTGGSYLISTPTHMFVFDGLIHFFATGNMYDLQIAENALIHLILPVLTLTYGLLAGVLRYIRAGMVDSMNQEYVKTARSKGVLEKDVIKKHIRKNALIPTITVMGLLFASLLGGVVVVETVFLYPGIGLFAVNAALGGTAGQLQPQIYGVLGVTLVFGIILMLANLVVDVIYALIDPRIRY